MSVVIPEKPIPNDDFTVKRWNHTALRHRMLEGLWADDLDKAISYHISGERQTYWGAGDMTDNAFYSSVDQASIMYDRLPIIDNMKDKVSGAVFVELLKEQNLWTFMQTVQPFVLGLNEAAVRPTVSIDDSGDVILDYRLVTPDFIEAYPDPKNKSTWNIYRELRLFGDGGKIEWAWEVFDISGSQPKYYLEQGGRDVTSKFLGKSANEFSGNNYEHRYGNSKPYIPAVLYHRFRQGKLFAPYKGVELIASTMTIGVLNTFLVHGAKNASWPQRGIIDAELDAQTDLGGTRSVESDPAVFLYFKSNGVNQPQILQWQAGVDIEKLANTIAIFKQNAAQYFGISPTDIQRTAAGDARSGYAIALSNEGKRTIQRKFEAQFRDGDRQLIGMLAAMINRKTGSNYPESGYNIEYPTLPLSPEERDAIRRDLKEKMEMKLISPIDAYLEYHPGLSREDAKQRLKDIYTDIREIEMVQPVQNLSTAPDMKQAPSAIGDSQPAISTTQSEAIINEKKAASDVLPEAIPTGIQIDKAMALVDKVITKEWDEETAIVMLEVFFGLDAEKAGKIINSIKTRRAPEPPATTQPFSTGA